MQVDGLERNFSPWLFPLIVRVRERVVSVGGESLYLSRFRVHYSE